MPRRRELEVAPFYHPCKVLKELLAYAYLVHCNTGVTHFFLLILVRKTQTQGSYPFGMKKFHTFSMLNFQQKMFLAVNLLMSEVRMKYKGFWHQLM